MIPRHDGTPTDQDVYDAIQMTSMCQQFQVLPHAGGLLDQDSYHVWIMQLVMSAQAEKEEHERALRAKENKLTGVKPTSRHR